MAIFAALLALGGAPAATAVTRAFFFDPPVALTVKTDDSFGAVVVHRLTQPMQLSAADILHAAENTNATLSPADGRVRAIIRHMGDPGTPELAEEVAHPVSWNVSAFTGVAPPGWQQGDGQRGYRDAPGSNAFQAAGAEFASWINSSSWTHASPVRGGGPQAQLYATVPPTAPRPWAVEGPPGVFATKPGRRLALEVSAKLPVPTPGNINVNLGFFTRRFSTVTDRFSGSWCRFPESWGQDGENGEKMGKKRGKMGEKWPKKRGVS